MDVCMHDVCMYMYINIRLCSIAQQISYSSRTAAFFFLAFSFRDRFFFPLAFSFRDTRCSVQARVAPHGVMCIE